MKEQKGDSPFTRSFDHFYGAAPYGIGSVHPSYTIDLESCLSPKSLI